MASSTTKETAFENILVIYPHGLGDCVMLTPALREFRRARGHKLHIATLERFKSAQFFEHCPHVDKIFYTKDAWHDYPNSQIGFASLYREWREFAKQNNFSGIVMPTHHERISKIVLNMRQLGVTDPVDYSTEVYISQKDKETASAAIKRLTGGEPYGFIQTHTNGRPKTDFPEGYGRAWLRENKNLECFIEIQKEIQPLDYNINVQFEILRRAAGVVVPDSVFYSACHALKKPVDLAYFPPPQMHSRVRPLVECEERVIFSL